MIQVVIRAVLFMTFIAMTSWQSKAQYIVPNSWQVGVGLGELPIDGSFKPSITLGHHFTKKLYAGIIYQLEDNIRRDNHSINARSAGLSGLQYAKENVARRFMLQGRCQLFDYAPYVSLGFVYNGNDVEQMSFNDPSYNGTVLITQSRRAGWGPAIGLGYQYNFRNGFSLNAEWTPAWFNKHITPEYEFGGTAELSPETQQQIADRMTTDFQKSVTNKYKVFHIGVAYRFQ